MYYMLAIFFGLIVLSVLLLRLCPIRPPPVRETFYGRATFAHACATANLQALRRDFAAGVRKLEGASTPVIYPEWFTQLEADLDELGKRLNERALVLPFTELYNNAIRMRRQVKEARSEVNRHFELSRAAGSLPENSDEDMNTLSQGRAAPIPPWESIEQQKAQPQETTRPLRRAKLMVT